MADLRRYWWIIALIVLSIGFRLAMPIAYDKAGDSAEYLQIAQSLASGQGYALHGHLTLLRSPGYPVYLAFGMKFFQIFGLFSEYIFWTQLLFLIATIYLIMKIFVGLKLKFEIPLLLLLLAYFPNYIYLQQALPEILQQFFLVLLVFCFMHNRFALAGVAFTLLMYVKGQYLFLPGLYFLYFLFKDKPIAVIKNFVIFGLVFIILTAPWVYRNYRIYHKPIISSVGLGNVLYPGNNPQNNGWWLGMEDAYWLNVVRNNTEIEADNILVAKALSNMKHQPKQVAKLWLKKAWRLVAVPVGYETLASKQALLAKVWLGLHWFILFLGVLGFVRRFNYLLALPIFYTFALHIVTYSIPRYFYPVWWLVVILVFCSFKSVETQPDLQD